jgi:bifunctional non-homologous end joining protein LigD
MADRLKKYRTMRDFGETPEPAGGRPKKGKLPIFVIQKHHASHLHYDFRLEMEGVLKSWAVPKGPSYDPGVKRLAMMTEDHPYDYAGFEGVIPAGNYGAGNVIIWDQGQWRFIEPGDDPVAALNGGKLTFELIGKKMRGEWALVKVKGRSPKGNEWLLLKHRDGYATDELDITAKAPNSVVSGKDVEDIGDAREWESNRKAEVGKKPATVADALRARAASGQKSASGKSAATKPASAPAARRKAKPGSAKKKTAAKR